MKQSVIERYLDQELWQHVVQCVELWPASNLRLTQHYERARWLLRLLYGTGLRVSEAANSRAQDLHLRRGHWWLHVVGKGHALGDVPISDELIKSYARYRVFHGLSPLPKPEESTPLILPLGGLSQTCLSPNALYLIVKKIFAVAAQAIEQQDAHAAQHLRRASTHWLRHTAATHQADAGNDLRFIQKNLRHASLSTTSVYLHADDDQRHAATTKAKSKPITT